MEEHTLESLDKLYKKDLVQIVLTLQNKLKSSNDEVLEEIHKLNIIFQKLESDISITKNTNSLLLKRVVDLERECWENAQYSRRGGSLEDIGLPEEAKIFINQSLCPYYRILWSKCKKLHSLDKIHTFYVSNGTIKIKISENSQPISITDTSDFDKYFPGVDFSPDN